MSTRQGRTGGQPPHQNNGANNNGMTVYISGSRGGSFTFNLGDGETRRQGPGHPGGRGGRGGRGGGSSGRAYKSRDPPRGPNYASPPAPPNTGGTSAAPSQASHPPPSSDPKASVAQSTLSPTGPHRAPPVAKLATPPSEIAPGLQRSKHAPPKDAFNGPTNSNYRPPYVSSANNSKDTSPHRPPPITQSGGSAGKGAEPVKSQHASRASNAGLGQTGAGLEDALPPGLCAIKAAVELFGTTHAANRMSVTVPPGTKPTGQGA